MPCRKRKKITSASWALACCCRFWALVFFNNSSFSERSLFQESLTEGKKGRVSKFAYDFLLRQPTLSPLQIIQWSIPNLLCASEKKILKFRLFSFSIQSPCHSESWAEISSRKKGSSDSNSEQNAPSWRTRADTNLGNFSGYQFITKFSPTQNKIGGLRPFIYWRYYWGRLTSPMCTAL